MIPISKTHKAIAFFIVLSGHQLHAQNEEIGWNDVSTSVSPPGGGQFDINAFVGATTYYNAGINGQNTTAIVTEAGHIWNGTESLTHMTNFYSSSFSYGGTNINTRLDRHATWVAGVLGGREVVGNPQIYQKGIAYGTTLGSAALASSWAGSAYSLSFGFSYNSWTGAVLPSFANANVINQSYGFTDSAGTNTYSRMMDALARSNSQVTVVASAGNNASAGSATSPGSGYNSITVGALEAANTFDSAASFSSRGPQNWGYRNSSNTIVVVSNARTVVDISAPGTSIIAPFYGAQTGGNNLTLSGSTNLGTATNSYSSLNGTSFAAPTVSGGATLVVSAAKTLPELQGNLEATESVVIKALLLNGATKTTGWNNNQTTNNGVVSTTQGLDYNTGAGLMNLGTTFTNQTQGQKGVTGKIQGSQGIVGNIGWDFGSSLLSLTNTYTLTGLFSSNTPITTTLSWLRQVSVNTNSASANATDIAEANLDLQIHSINPDGSLKSLVGSSESGYNVTEHLNFALPTTGYYAISIRYNTNSFDNTGTWGTSTNTQNYGIAWRSASAESIYWQSGNWDNDSAWNTLANGSGVATTNTSVVVNTVFGDGSQAQSPTTIIVDGTQYTRGLVFQSDNTSLIGSNSASLNLGKNGITIENSTTGSIMLNTDTSITLAESQIWENKSSQTLYVLGQISGTGNLTLNNSSAVAQTTLANVGITGSLVNTGLGTTTITNEINNQVVSVTQSGSGRLNLNGNSTYTGNTFVTDGKLSVNGSIASSDNTTASNTGTLQGNGSVGDTLITSGGTINPGNSVGLLTVEGNLTWDINGNYNWEIYDANGVAGTGYDTINVNGFLDLSLLGPSEFNINLWSLSSSSPDINGNAINFDQNQNYLWTIVSTVSGITGFNETKFDINTISTNGTTGFNNDLNGAFSVYTYNTDLILSYNTVPEPQTMYLLLIAGTYFWFKRIRGRNKNI